MEGLMNGRDIITVIGFDNATRLAKAFIKAGYDVLIHNGDLDTYDIIYEHPYDDVELGSDRFAIVTLEEANELLDKRREEQLEEAKKLVSAAQEEEEFDNDDEENDPYYW